MSSKGIAKSRERLVAGVLRFQREIYPPMQATYQRLAQEGQKPHTLFITCADSRVNPELITQSGPGEIFVCRNVGNLVPPYGETAGGVAAIIEYAVAALRVSHVVVGGHTDCGAMNGLLHPEKVKGLPMVTSWLRNGDSALSIVRNRKTVRNERSVLEDLIEENVLQQLQHLRTYPSVAGRLAEGALALSGWVYDIGHGIVRIYDEEQRRFSPVTAARQMTSGAAGR